MPGTLTTHPAGPRHLLPGPWMVVAGHRAVAGDPGGVADSVVGFGGVVVGVGDDGVGEPVGG